MQRVRPRCIQSQQKGCVAMCHRSVQRRAPIWNAVCLLVAAARTSEVCARPERAGPGSGRHRDRRQDQRDGCRRQRVRRARADRQVGSGLRGEEEGVRRVSGRRAERAAGGEAGRRRRPRPDRHQLALDAEHRLPRALHAGRIRAAHLRPGAQEERRAPDDAELRGVRLRVPRLLRRRVRVPVRRGRASTPRRPTSAARRR